MIEQTPPGPLALGLAASGAFSLAVAVLLFAILGIVVAAQPRRIFWAGFALFGWAYLLAVIGPHPVNMREHLVTQKLLERAPGVKWHSTIERQIGRKLEEPIAVDFDEVPLHSAFDFLHQSTGVNFVMDKPALEEEGISADTPISLQLDQVPCRSVLGLLLNQYNLAYLIKDDVVQITSKLTSENEWDEQKWQFEQLCHGLLTLLIATCGGWIANIWFAGYRLKAPRFSMRFLLCLPLMFAIVFGLTRSVGIEAASIIGAAAVVIIGFLLQVVRRLRRASESTDQTDSHREPAG